MVNDVYKAYEELAREEDFRPQDERGIVEGSVTSWRERVINRNLRRTLVIILVCLVVYFFYLNRLFVKVAGEHEQAEHAAQEMAAQAANPSIKVPLEAHIMSQCVDARDCLQQLVVPAMERISDKVDFQLSFIGKYVRRLFQNSSDCANNDTRRISNKTSDVECKHGPSECIGNILMLCAANLPFPPDNPSQRTPTIRSLGFANCLVGDYKKIPERTFVEHCAAEHGIDFDALNACASHERGGLDDPSDPTPDDPSGIALLRLSVQHSAEVGVTRSCTVRLDEKIWCIRDGGQWKDCPNGSSVSRLVDEVERLWKLKNES